MPVKAPPAPLAAPRPLTWRRRALYALGGAVVAVLVFQFVLLPWLLRNRVRNALLDAGFENVRFTVSRATLWGAELRDVQLGEGGDGIARADIKYMLDDLFAGKIDALRLAGVRYTLDPSLKGPAKTSINNSVGTQGELPIRQINVVDSTLVVAGPRPVEIPLQATLERKGDGYELNVTAGEGSAVSLFGTLDRTMREGSVSANIHALGAELASKIARSLLGANVVSASGAINGTVAATWQHDATHVAGKIELSGASADGKQASGDKLHLTQGVFIGEARFGPTTRPSGSINVAGADLATSWLSASGLSTRLDFPATTQPQKLTASQVKIGQMELTEGNLEFAMNDQGDISINQTRWNWLGGELSASNFAVPRDGPLSVTVQLRDVELGELLKLLAEQKATGQGKLTGELPVTIDGAKVTFGNGRITSLEGGALQIKDAAAVAPAAEAAAQQVATGKLSADQIKRDVIEALGDFQYDRLTGRLVNEGDDLSAYIRMSGRGRTGAQQALDYEWRVHGLDEALRFYLGVRKALDARNKDQGKAGS